MNPGDLVTWAQVKDVLSLDDDRQELTEFLISAASATAERIAGRFLAARDLEVSMDADGASSFLLPSYPVNRIDTLSVNGQELLPENFKIDSQAGIIRLRRAVSGWESICEFKGNIGYDPVPYDLQQAVIETVSANLRRFAGSGGSVGIKQMSANGAITTQYEIDVPVSSRSVFISYRGVRV